MAAVVHKISYNLNYSKKNRVPEMKARFLQFKKDSSKPYKPWVSTHVHVESPLIFETNLECPKFVTSFSPKTTSRCQVFIHQRL